MSLVIADAGPLIALSRVEQLALLRLLFQEVVITEEVRAEVLDNDHQRGQEIIHEAIEKGWLIVQKVDMQNWSAINAGVDRGEASAICLASQSADNLLLIDDQAGRAEASSRNIRIVGTAAVVGMAKLQGHIVSARQVLEALREAGYYIGDKIIASVLADIGEV